MVALILVILGCLTIGTTSNFFKGMVFVNLSHCLRLRSRNLHNHGAGEQADMNVFKEWVKKRKELFEMGEKRGEEDIPPRDMPASTGLDILGWRSNTPLKKVLSWFDIDFEYGNNEYLTSLNNMGPPGEDIFITDQRGIWTLFSDFYSNFPEKILLNKTVSKIKYDSDGVEVTIAGGETFSADYALCTFGSGVLNSGSVQFDPPLPDWKKEAIYRLKPVHLTKVFLKFPSDFWDDNEWILHVSLPTPSQNYPAFFDLDRSGFFPGSTTLFTGVTGDQAFRVELQDDNRTMEEVMQVLRDIYGSNVTNATGSYFFTCYCHLFNLVKALNTCTGAIVFKITNLRSKVCLLAKELSIVCMSLWSWLRCHHVTTIWSHDKWLCCTAAYQVSSLVPVVLSVG